MVTSLDVRAVAGHHAMPAVLLFLPWQKCAVLSNKVAIKIVIHVYSLKT